jgi:alcohol dehydrogenase class IV
VTAATGIDALAHCVEGYTSKRAHPTIDIYALEGIRLVGQFIGRAVRDGSDQEARAGMALASLYGGFCLGPVNTTAGHAVSYPLGTRHNIAHGLANALIFPHVLAFNAPVVEAKTRNVLEALSVSQAIDADAIRAEVGAFCAALGIDMALSAHGVPRDDLPIMADDAATIRRLLDFNPRDISRDDILEIYETAY